MGAQEAKLTTTVSKNKLGLNQRLRVEFSINKQGGDNFTPPRFQNFRIVGGPSQSISQSYFNGKSSYKQSYSYIVQPTKKGILIIPAASIDVDGKKIKSDARKSPCFRSCRHPKRPK